MAWTYTDDPLNVPRDAVRMLVGDTDENDQQPISDNEIAYLLSIRGGDVNWAAVDAAEKLAAYYSRQADITNGKTQVSASQRRDGFHSTADDLRQRARSLGAPTGIFFGGQTISGNEALATDVDAVQPSFSVGMDDEPGTNPDPILRGC